jgi:hypothetical protein
LIYEPEAACRRLLLADGHGDRQALEISSYLAQSTDLALEFEAFLSSRSCSTMLPNACRGWTQHGPSSGR